MSYTAAVYKPAKRHFGDVLLIRGLPHFLSAGALVCDGCGVLCDVEEYWLDMHSLGGNPDHYCAACGEQHARLTSHVVVAGDVVDVTVAEVGPSPAVFTADPDEEC